MPLDLRPLRKWVDAQASTAEAARMLDMQRTSLIRLLTTPCPNVTTDTLDKIARTIGVEPGVLFRRSKVV